MVMASGTEKVDIIVDSIEREGRRTEGITLSKATLRV